MMFIRLPERNGMTCAIQLVVTCMASLPHLMSASLVSVCNTTTEYQCSSGRCIDLEKVNNSINDCQDNSDEVSNPCRSPMFSCWNNRCILPIWVLDGRNDCLDFTDEVKFVGTNCTSAVNCCFCDQFVPNSICLDGICQCRQGHYSNQPGTSCLSRVIGDSCQTDLDCNSVISLSICEVGEQQQQQQPQQPQCQCISGYYPSQTKDKCIKRTQIDDGCHNNSECSAIGNSICVDAACRCISGHQQTQDGYLCHLVAINDPCDQDLDCGISQSYCLHQTCTCRPGLYPTNSNRKCKLRRITSACVTDDDCSMAVNNSICSVGRCRCSIDHDLSPVTRNDCIYAMTLQRDKMISSGLLTAVILLVMFIIILSWYFITKFDSIWNNKRPSKPFGL